MDVYRTFILPIFLYGCETWTWTEVQVGRLEVNHFNRLLHIVGMKLMDCHRLETIREECARSDAEDGRVEQRKSRPGHRNIKDFLGINSSAIQGCHEEGYGDCTTFRDFLKLPGRTKLIPWPEIQAAAAERPGLVNGALCNDCALAAEDLEVIASGKASEKSKEHVTALSSDGDVRRRRQTAPIAHPPAPLAPQQASTLRPLRQLRVSEPFLEQPNLSFRRRPRYRASRVGREWCG
eukprot:353872-Chlamydomonas_euryale.AAC.16